MRFLFKPLTWVYALVLWVHAERVAGRDLHKGKRKIAIAKNVPPDFIITYFVFFLEECDVLAQLRAKVLLRAPPPDLQVVFPGEEADGAFAPRPRCQRRGRISRGKACRA